MLIKSDIFVLFICYLADAHSIFISQITLFLIHGDEAIVVLRWHWIHVLTVLILQCLADFVTHLSLIHTIKEFKLWPMKCIAMVTTLTLLVIFQQYPLSLHHLPWDNYTIALVLAKQPTDIISYPSFADADMGIYPPAAKRGVTILSVDKFPYPWKQARGNKFIPCSNNICDILKCFRSFKIPAITLIWPKSPYKHSVTRSYCSGKEKGRRSELPLWRHQWRSFVFITHADDVKREIRLHISRLLTNQKRESA